MHANRLFIEIKRKTAPATIQRGHACPRCGQYGQAFRVLAKDTHVNDWKDSAIQRRFGSHAAAQPLRRAIAVIAIGGLQRLKHGEDARRPHCIGPT